MIDWLTELQLNYGHVIKPMIVGTLVSIVCSVIGCFIVLRRMLFLADAIAHAMLAGVIGGYLIMKLVFGSEASLGGMLIGAILGVRSDGRIRPHQRRISYLACAV